MPKKKTFVTKISPQIEKLEINGSNALGICDHIKMYLRSQNDRLCGLVVSVLGHRSGGPGSIPSTTREKKVVGLERGPLSLVSTKLTSYLIEK
jgi:hypothetical protein